MGAVVVAFSFADFILLLSSFNVVPDQHAAFNIFMREPMWFDGGNLPAFVGADKVCAEQAAFDGTFWGYTPSRTAL